MAGMTKSRYARAALIALVCALAADSAAPRAGAASPEPLAVALRGSIALPSTAVDQHGATFTISGLSGITHRGGSLFTVVMDNSNRLVQFDVKLDANGEFASASLQGALTLADSRDFEGVAYTNAQRRSVWLSDETQPQLREYRLDDGALVQTVETPAVALHRRGGFGWESLARSADGLHLWTANEEALTVDGLQTSPTQSSVVRLVRFDASAESYVPAAQFAYVVDPWHGGDSPATTAERSGLVDLVALPDGRLISLERSLAFTGPIPSFQNRIYEIDLSSATDVSSFDALAGATYQAASKRLLWSGAVAGPLGMNMEGLALGPRLPNGHATLLGIVDDGGASDPLSNNTLVSFEITSTVAPPSIRGDANFDGRVDRADMALAATTFGTPLGATWADGDFDGDGAVTLADLVVIANGGATSSPNIPAAIALPLQPIRYQTPAPEPWPLPLFVAGAFALIVAQLILRRRRRMNSR
jgi:hypothetical protein